MGRMAGLMVVAGVTVFAGIASSDWLAKSETGLRQLMSGSVAMVPVEDPAVTISAAWREVGKDDNAAVAMSEQEWLKLGDDLAPVSYYAEPASAPAAAVDDQQPL